MPAASRFRFALIVPALLSACSTTPPSRPAAPAAPAPVVATPLSTPATPAAPAAPAAAASAAPSNAAEQRTAAAATLTVEQKWLDSFFRGTPVAIRQLSDGSLAVDVPREFCFEPGRAQIKPPLAAVLDKLAESLRRRPASRLVLLAAPDDKPGATPLALQRAAELHKQLRGRGVPAARMGEPSAAPAAAVQLRVAPQSS